MTRTALHLLAFLAPSILAILTPDFSATHLWDPFEEMQGQALRCLRTYSFANVSKSWNLVPAIVFNRADTRTGIVFFYHFDLNTATWGGWVE